jgi:hypothetical protein
MRYGKGIGRTNPQLGSTDGSHEDTKHLWKKKNKTTEELYWHQEASMSLSQLVVGQLCKYKHQQDEIWSGGVSVGLDYVFWVFYRGKCPW